MRPSALRVSIALCTCDGATFLPEQLASILRQTRLPDEIVLVDDASGDSTVAIARSMLAGARCNVRIEVNASRLGITRNFERALSLTTGEVVVLCDQDDVWLPQKLDRIAAEFQRHPGIGLLASNADVVDEALNPFGVDTLTAFSPRGRALRTSDEIFVHLLAYGNVFPGMVLAFAGALRRVVLGFPEFVGDDAGARWMHDGWIAVALAAMAPTSVITEPLALYRQHAGQHLGIAGRPVDGRARVPFTLQLAREVDLRQRLLQVLLERSGRSGVRDRALLYLEQSIEHLTFRRDLYAKRVRARRVAPELASGRYRRFSNGWHSAVRDVVSQRGDVVDRG